jgi:hypothetical protein
MNHPFKGAVGLCACEDAYLRSCMCLSLLESVFHFVCDCVCDCVYVCVKTIIMCDATFMHI